jgi:hypothetical protein
VHGPGIYSTPDINVAKRYAKSFIVNAQEYLVVLQNRVNPKNGGKIYRNVGRLIYRKFRFLNESLNISKLVDNQKIKVNFGGQVGISIYRFCETRYKRSAEV